MSTDRRRLPKVFLTRWAAMFYWTLPGVNLHGHVGAWQATEAGMSTDREALPPDHSGLPEPRMRGEEGGSPDDFAVTEELRAADEAASLVHDYIWGKNGVTKEQANDAIWKIHNTLRPLFEVADLGY